MNPSDLNRNDGRTRAFDLEKKQRRNDSVSWIVVSVLLLFVNVISIGRITVVGQFIDDIVFTFLFGWFKYAMYLIFIGINVCVYFGIKFRFKKRFLLMVFATWCVLAWIISSVLYICAFHLHVQALAIEHYISKDIFINIFDKYISNWRKYSFLGEYKSKSWILSDPNCYFSLWAGGGFIGAFFSAVASYTTIYGNAIISVISLFTVLIWLFTGDPFYLVKPKSKRTGKRLRILSLGSKLTKDKHEKKLQKVGNKKKLFQVDYFDSNVSDYDFNQSMTFADITIELPGFKRDRDAETVDEFDDVYGKYSYDNEPPNVQFGGTSYYEDERISEEIDYDNFIANQPRESYNQNLNSVHNQNINNNYQNTNNQVQRQAPQPIYDSYNDDGYDKNSVGDFPSESARRNFERETSITPFGANGKTMEIIKNKNGYYDRYDSDTKENENNNPTRQMELDDFVADNNVRSEPVKAPEYETPLKRRASSGHNTQNFDWAQNMTSEHKVSHEKKVSKTLQYINKAYRLPTPDLLNPEKNNVNLLNKLKSEAVECSKKIDDVFASFNVKARVNDFLIGPSITQFIVTLESGVKVQSILGLENEIKLRLATTNVLMQAPIDGKPAVGIEVPNSVNQPVNIKSVIGKEPINKINSKLLFPIGKNVVGNVIFGELSSMPHLLVAGSTGSGKSVMINSIITSILMKAKPNEVKMMMIDPKKVELIPYANIPHLLVPIISDMSFAAAALKKVVHEMERRYNLFSENGVKNITGYNDHVKNDEEKLPYYVIIIDELADLMLTENKKAVEDSIMRLTQMARAAGIHLIVATQRPSTDVITGVIKANIPSRISFAVANQYDSRTILDTQGAEKLAGKGDMLFMEPGTQKPVRAQGIYVGDDEIQRITEFCASQQEQIFEEEFLLSESSSDDAAIGGDALDSLYDEAIELITNYNQASTSFLQRRLRIGYSRASRLIDQLEENGVIGPQNGSKSRDIFVKK